MAFRDEDGQITLPGQVLVWLASIIFVAGISYASFATKAEVNTVKNELTLQVESTKKEIAEKEVKNQEKFAEIIKLLYEIKLELKDKQNRKP